jgi:hypothetical protein
MWNCSPVCIKSTENIIASMPADVITIVGSLLGEDKVNRTATTYPQPRYTPIGLIYSNRILISSIAILIASENL